MKTNCTIQIRWVEIPKGSNIEVLLPSKKDIRMRKRRIKFEGATLIVNEATLVGVFDVRGRKTVGGQPCPACSDD